MSFWIFKAHGQICQTPSRSSSFLKIEQTLSLVPNPSHGLNSGSFIRIFDDQHSLYVLNEQNHVENVIFTRNVEPITFPNKNFVLTSLNGKVDFYDPSGKLINSFEPNDICDRPYLYKDGTLALFCLEGFNKNQILWLRPDGTQIDNQKISGLAMKFVTMNSSGLGVLMSDSTGNSILMFISSTGNISPGQGEWPLGKEFNLPAQNFHDHFVAANKDKLYIFGAKGNVIGLYNPVAPIDPQIYSLSNGNVAVKVGEDLHIVSPQGLKLLSLPMKKFLTRHPIVTSSGNIIYQDASGEVKVYNQAGELLSSQKHLGLRSMQLLNDGRIVLDLASSFQLWDQNGNVLATQEFFFARNSLYRSQIFPDGKIAVFIKGKLEIQKISPIPPPSAGLVNSHCARKARK